MPVTSSATLYLEKSRKTHNYNFFKKSLQVSERFPYLCSVKIIVVDVFHLQSTNNKIQVKQSDEMEWKPK